MTEIMGFLALWGVLLGGLSKSAFASPDAIVVGPWVQLRKSPTFTAPVQAMAPTWGPTIPMGDAFHVEKVYGRWLYGKPSPLLHMKAKDFAHSGWIYTRMIVVPGDEAVESPSQRDEVFYVNYYSQEAWRRLGLASGSEGLLYFTSLESLILSQKTLGLFRSQDEVLVNASQNHWNFWNEALAAEPVAPAITANTAATTTTIAATPQAEIPGKKKEELFVPEKPKGPALGLSGAHLEFLHQESIKVVKRKNKEQKAREALILKPREIKPISANTKNLILARLIADQELRLPSLTHEEVDGSLYMRAIVHRTLEGCPQSVKDAWKDKHWFVFRILGQKTKSDEKDIWYQFSLPGGYYALSNRSIAEARNEAELAFLLIRPLVRQERLQALNISAEGKNWPQELRDQMGKIWGDSLRVQSTKLSSNLDVADEISVDLAASECIARAGYHWQAGLRYLQRMRSNREETWARWFVEHSIGLDYRIQQFEQRLLESVKRQQIPENDTINKKRFETAVELWNTRG